MNWRKLAGFSCLAALVGCSAAYHPSNWLSLVPAESRTLQNPLPKAPQQVAEGAQTYKLYCTSCHGEDGGGRRGRPSLRSVRVRSETDGEIFWILVNGSTSHGMPAWHTLGDTALWQLVEYIRALPPSPQ